MSDFEGNHSRTSAEDMFLTEEFLAAARAQGEYRDGTRQVDTGWISTLFNDPGKGELLEGILRDQVGVGRRDPGQQDAVEADVRSIVAHLVDTSVALTPELTAKRDGFLQFLDLIKPDTEG